MFSTALWLTAKIHQQYTQVQLKGSFMGFTLFVNTWRLMNNLCELKMPWTWSLKYYTVSILFNSSSSSSIYPIQGHAGIGGYPKFVECGRKSERTPGSPERTNKPQTEPPAGSWFKRRRQSSVTPPPQNILAFLSSVLALACKGWWFCDIDRATRCGLFRAVRDILHYFKWISISKSSLQYSDRRNYLNPLFKTNYWNLIRKNIEIRNQFKLCNKFKGMNQKHLKQQINSKMHTCQEHAPSQTL